MINTSYASRMQQLADAIAGVPDSSDHTFNALAYMALALAEVERSKEAGADLIFNGRPLVVPSLERAFREMLNVRSKMTDLDISVLSRYGRLNENRKV